MAEAGSVIPPIAARPVKNTIVLFDVDGTLTPARLVRIPREYLQCPSKKTMLKARH